MPTRFDLIDCLFSIPLARSSHYLSRLIASLMKKETIMTSTVTAPPAPREEIEPLEDRHEPASAEQALPLRKRPRTATKNGVKPEDFAVLNARHPYGVLPVGNRFLLPSPSAGSAAASSTREGEGGCCGSPTSLMASDECWYRVLEYCDGRDLGRVVQTCRYFYAAASEPELWRDLVLQREVGKTIALAGPTWKDAYVKISRCSTRRSDAGGGEADKKDGHYPPHKPMPVSGIYSDFFYRLHSCRSFAIPDAWLDTKSDTMPRVPVDEMTVQMFEEKFEKPNRPVVVEGACRGWKAFQHWADPQYLLEHTKGRTFRATSGAAPLPGLFTLDAYCDYCHSSHLEEAPLYLFDRTALAPGSDLWKDYMDDMKRTCPYWDPDREDVSHDLFKVLGEGRRPE